MISRDIPRDECLVGNLPPWRGRDRTVLGGLHLRWSGALSERQERAGGAWGAKKGVAKCCFWIFRLEKRGFIGFWCGFSMGFQDIYHHLPGDLKFEVVKLYQTATWINNEDGIPPRWINHHFRQETTLTCGEGTLSTVKRCSSEFRHLRSFHLAEL